MKFFSNHKEMLRRAARTFYQAFIGSLAVNLPLCDEISAGIIQSLIISAIGAGLAAVMNYKEDKKL